MAQYLFADNAITTLASPISAVATSLSVVSGAGALFPNPIAGQQFTATLVSATNPLVKEIVLVTARVSDTFTTIARAQEGTAAVAWNAGDTVMQAATAGALNSLGNSVSQQAQSGNYAIDVGTGGAYAVVLNPPLTAHVIGMPIRFKASNTNFPGPTFNDGVATAPFVFPDGVGLLAGVITVNGIYEAIWDGSKFQFQEPDIGLLAPKVSPAFGGVPTAPTAGAGTSTTQLATTQFVSPGFQLGSNGFRKFSDGGITQWGESAPAGSVVSITFPTPFPSSCSNIVAVPVGVNSALFISQPSANRLGFTVTLGASGTQVCWKAEGF